MGNLGLYQTFTTVAKQFGGPGKLLIAIAAGGVAVGVAIGAFAKPVVVKVVSAAKKRSMKNSITDAVFTVSSEPGEAATADMNGLVLHIGDQFRVVESDGDAICIEVLENANNPYYLSGELLEAISDFRRSSETADL